MALLALVTAPAAAAAAPTGYVALGDSYAAGPLIPTQTGRPAGCLRSSRNYPAVVAGHLGVAEFTDVSCSAAVTDDLANRQLTVFGVARPQLSAVSAETDLVTLTIGGNDIGFADIVIECAVRSPKQPRGAACRDYYTSGGTDQLAARIADTADEIAGALAAIKDRAPQAQVLLVGYPAILPEGRGCFPFIPYTPGDVAYLRGVLKQLNAMLAEQAAAAGVGYVDTYGATVGHDICTRPGVKWIEGLVPTSAAAPVHPNALGMAAIADVVSAAVSDTASAAT